MITNEPDLTIDLHKLEQKIQSYRDEIALREQWYLREAYYDFGGKIDPHYCIIFRNDVEDPGDNVMDAPLLETNRPELGYVNLTCFTIANNRDYWQPVDRELLIQRLDRFLAMNRENYLQPPGSTGDLYGASNPHPRFEGVRFLYQVVGLLAPGITGIGPAMFAGAGPCGALRGQLLGDNQSPLQGVTVELVLQQENNNNPAALTRETGENGLFWFSRVPAGTYNLKVHGQNRVYGIRVLKNEPESFGLVEGRIYHQQGHPLVGVSLHLQAPDGEVFPVLSGSDGRFRSGSLPAFPYTLRVPGFLFTAQISVVADAVLGGTLIKQDGPVLAGKQVILKQEGVENRIETTDEHGNFRFDRLSGGRYSIEVPGYRLFSRIVTPGSIEGKITGVTGPVTIELLAREEVAASARSFADGSYRFENLVPGSYRLRSPGLLLKKEGV